MMTSRAGVARSLACVLAALLAPIAPPAFAELAVGEPMPRFRVQTWQGEAVEIDPADHEVLVVEFWATWCRPCRELLPAMADVVARIDDPRLRVLVVNIESDRALADRFLGIHLPKRSLPLYRDPDNRLMSRFGAPGMPVTYVVVRGSVRVIEVGYSGELRDALPRLIRAALDGDM